jgi:ADP-heptose:LPS heptosyltransferase
MFRNKKKIDPERIRKILFITLSNIGDAVLTTPSLDLLRRFFPHAHITVMVGPRAAEIFEDHPHIDRLILYDKHATFRDKLSLILHLKAEKYDLVVDLRNTLIPLFIQPRFSTPLFRKKVEGHAVKRHLERLHSIGIAGKCGFVLPSREEDEKIIDRLLASSEWDKASRLIVINPSAANRLKRWDLLKFKALADQLKFIKGISIAVTGPKSDEKEFQEIFPESEWMNLTGKLTLMQLKSLLARATLFITNDSGPMHMAVAVKTPVLALFGPTDPQIYGPLGSQHRVIRLEELPCSPCMKGFCRIQTHDCMKNLEVQRVFETACQMLS